MQHFLKAAFFSIPMEENFFDCWISPFIPSYHINKDKKRQYAN